MACAVVADLIDCGIRESCKCAVVFLSPKLALFIVSSMTQSIQVHIITDFLKLTLMFMTDA